MANLERQSFRLGSRAIQRENSAVLCLLLIFITMWEFAPYMSDACGD